MYFNNKNNFFHGITFHHFHDDNLHKKGQGSITKDDFYKILKFIGRENILDANDFFTRLKENKLKEKNVCLTFDDAIKCQYDIALPVLEDLKIKSFFFIYSSPFKGEITPPEMYRYFRNFVKKIILKISKKKQSIENSNVKIAVAYNEGINLDKRSDLFWLTNSKIDPKDVILYFEYRGQLTRHAKKKYFQEVYIPD